MLRRRLLALTALTLAAATCFSQGNETVQMRPVKAQTLAGIVTVKANHRQPINDAHVEECDADWKHVIASTMTDAEGHFRLTPVETAPIFYLRVYAPGFNISQYPVTLSRFAHVELHLEMSVGT
jgi:hypothetical protein